MPKIFGSEMFLHSSEIVMAYADKHTPVIDCADVAKRNEKLKVRVYVGTKFIHPSTINHYFAYIQLWDLEKLVAEVRFQSNTFGDKPIKPEIDFYIVPKLSMRLVAHSYCTKHGLWKSDEVFVKVID